MTLATGTLLHNRYRIVKLVGQGGFGAVYRGWDTALERPVAVKEHFDTGTESQRQFEREAKLLAGLRHTNLPVVIDHFILPGQGQYLVMDFIEGKSLGDLLLQRGRPLAEAEALPWIRQVADALEYLHTRTPPIIHRDIKPENIIITHDGRAMLVDFGISKLYDPSKGTTVGAKAVTPGYSPPEQYGRGRTDARSDVYALGATLYTLLTGKIPPEAPDLSSGADVLIPPRAVNPAVSEAASRAVVAAMALPISQRLPSAAGLGQLLAGGAPPLPPTAPVVSRSSSAASPMPAPPTGGAKRTGVPIWGWLLGVLALVALAAWAGATFGGGGEETAATPPEATAVLAAVDVTARPAATTTATAPPEPQAGDVRVVDRGGMAVEQVYVPAGSFMMGSEDGDPDERPVHEVTLDAFWIDRTEVTNAQYAACVADRACRPPQDNSSYTRESYYGNPEFADYPVIYVSWDYAADFAAWAGGRLPTEAEWEYAARGPESQVYPWGNTFDGERLNFCDQNCPFDHRDMNWDDGHADTAPAGSYPEGASWVGALDMAGNVWEWVNDRYEGDYYGSSPIENPTGPTSGGGRVLRGGSWNNLQRNARASIRSLNTPDFANNSIGIRSVAPVGSGS